MQNSLRQTKRTDEFVQVLNEIDLKRIGQAWAIGNIVQYLCQQPETQQAGFKLFDRAWASQEDANKRSQLLSSVSYQEQFWQQPDAWKYAAAYLLAEDAKKSTQFFSGNSRGRQNDRVMGPFVRSMEVAARLNKLAEVEQKVEGQLAQVDQSDTGTVAVCNAFLAILEARQKKFDEAVPRLTAITAAISSGSLKPDAWTCEVVAQELGDSNEVAAFVLPLYELSVEETLRLKESVYQESCGKRLVAAYKSAGQPKKAYELLTRFAERKRETPQYNIEYEAYRTLQELENVGNELLTLNRPIDAIRIFNRAAADRKSQEAAKNYWNRKGDDHFQKLTQKAVESLSKLPVGQLLDDLIPGPESLPSSSEPAVELGILVQPETLNAATVKSLVAEVLLSGKISADEREAALKRLATVAEARPEDCSIAFLQSVLSLDDSESARTTLQRLHTLITNVEPDNVSATAQVQRIGLWHLAQAAATRESLADISADLAAVAEQAAGSHPDSKWLLAMMREKAERAATNGNRDIAEKAFRSLMRLVTETEMSPGEKTNTTTHRSRKTLTTDQFEKLLQVAESAAAQGLTNLAVTSISEALENGPPMDPIPLDQLRGRSRQMFGGQQAAGSAADLQRQKLASKLKTLSAKWRELENVPPEPVYQMLKALVFPGETLDVRLYWANLTSFSSESLALELAHWAREANVVDDVFAEITRRSSNTATTVPGNVLRLMVAKTQSDTDTTRQILTSLTKSVNSSEDPNLALSALRSATQFASDKAVAAEILELLFACAPHVQSTQLVYQFDASVQSAIKTAGASLDAESLKALLVRYLKVVDPRHGDSNNAEYNLYRRRQQLDTVVSLLLRNQQVADGMKYAAEAVDINLPERNYGQFMMPTLVSSLHGALGKMSPDARFRLLMEWVLPDDSKKIPSRQVCGSLSPAVPARVLELSGLPVQKPTATFSSTFSLLLDVADGVNKTDDVRTILDAADADDQTIQSMKTLLDIRTGRNDAVLDFVESRIEEIKKQTPTVIPKAYQSNVWPLTNERLVGEACLNVPELEEAGHRLMLTCEKYQRMFGRPASAFQIPVLKPTLNAAYGSIDRTIVGPGLKYWRASSLPFIGSNTQERNYWVADGKRVGRIAPSGGYLGGLMLRFPVVGKFEFDLDVTTSAARSMLPSYGALTLMNVGNSSTASLHLGVVGGRPQSATVTLPGKPDDTSDHWKLVSDGEQVEFFVNDKSVLTDESISPSSPWLQLLPDRLSGQSMVSNIILTGQPSVPAQVALLGDDRMDGWSGSYYYEFGNADISGRMDSRVTVQNHGGQFQVPWSVKKGVLTAETSDAANTSDFSWLCYHRPLWDGDELRYEFFYKQGTTQVHPAIGRTAMVLAPDGIKLHWMTPFTFNGMPASNTSVADDNLFDVVENRRGPAEVPLKDNSWNAVTISQGTDATVVSLNGVEVYSLPVDEEDQQLFGFYRNRRKDNVKVRNVVLKGNWPTELTPDILENLLAPESGATAEQLEARKQLLQMESPQEKVSLNTP